MKRAMTRHLALQDLLRPERLNELADHQREKMRELARRSEQELALAIQQCYRHVLYPSKNRVEGAPCDLAHAAIEVHTASQTPGEGQKSIIQVLRECKKLRLPEDDADSPSYIRDRTPLRKGKITTMTLRAEFRRDPVLPILIGDETFLRGIRQGIEAGEYVYQSGDLIWAKGQPFAVIKIDENSVVYTATYASDNAIWPRPAPPHKPPADPGKPGYTITDSTDLGDHTNLLDDPNHLVPEKRPDTKTATLPPSSEITAEGPLKEALANLWEQARTRKLGTVGVLILKLYDPTDAFRVMAMVGSLPKATKAVHIAGGYETADGGTLEISFDGPVSDAQPLKDFLEPQLRAAKEKDLEVILTVTFTDGLDLSGTEPEQLTERLGKFGSSAAFVSASAKEHA